MSATVRPRVDVTYQPILDVARGAAAGYQAQVVPDGSAGGAGWAGIVGDDLTGHVAAAVAELALGAAGSLPVNTFLSVPLGVHAALSDPVRTVLLDRDLSGFVLDLIGSPSAVPAGELEQVVELYRAAGALIAVGGHGAPQPELTSIVRFKPSIIRLGRDWVRGIDRSAAKRSAVEVIGQLAGQLDSWILAEGVASAAELRALAGLGVPLAQGSFIGSPQTVWPEIELSARVALPRPTGDTDGVLRELIQQAYTATDEAAAAAILPETTGFDVVVVVDERQRPITLLEQGTGAWQASEVLTLNIDTPVGDAVQRAMTRPRPVRFTPLVCTDDAGRFVGILRIERLMGHLAAGDL